MISVDVFNLWVPVPWDLQMRSTGNLVNESSNLSKQLEIRLLVTPP